jgi:hypothetical protein
MTLIVETGAIDPNANSYASIAQADARHSTSTSADAWDNLDPAQKEQRLITATRRLDALFDWVGTPYRHDQPLGFPRRNLYDQTGRPVYMKTVPTTVRNAAIDLALWLPEDTPSASSAGTDDVIEEITLGPIGIKMAAASSSGTTPTARPLIPSDIIMALRHFGSYVGGGVGVGRLVR